MKKALIIICISCGVTLCADASAQTTSYRHFPAQDTLLNTQYTKLKLPNIEHQCGIGRQVGSKRAPANIEVFPTAIVTQVGNKVEVRFDASNYLLWPDNNRLRRAGKRAPA